MSAPPRRHDVIVLGAGIAGSALALALHRAGLDVALLDSASHPRFALGESSLPATSLWMRAIAERWRVPELHRLASATRVNREVASTSGVKRNIGFVYHRPGEPAHGQAWCVPLVEGGAAGVGESHLFRQDVDAYLCQAALAAGVPASLGVALTDVEVDQQGGRVALADGRRLEARFLVDATGHGSVLSRRYALREQPCRLRTHSRTLFTHMIGVQPFDRFYSGPRPPTPWHSGTLHHFFDRGWVWVIPFDNHPDSTNRLCSVGLSLDARRYPRPEGCTAEEEWERLLREYPSLAGPFREARAVRPWVATGRLQYANTTAVGPRFWITPQASGTVDALYSRGMLNTFMCLHAAIPAILRACREDDFAVERLAELDALQRECLALHDVLAYGSYAASRDPRLLELWLAVWFGIGGLDVNFVLPALRRYARTGQAGLLDFDAERPRRAIPHAAALWRQLDALAAAMEPLESGEADVDETRERLRRLLARGGGPGPEAVVHIFSELVFSRRYRARMLLRRARRALLRPLRARRAVIDLGPHA